MSTTDTENVTLSERAQEVKFVIMLLEEINEEQKPSVIQEDTQGEIFLAKKRKVGMSNKHIDICHRFIRQQQP